MKLLLVLMNLRNNSNQISNYTHPRVYRKTVQNNDRKFLKFPSLLSSEWGNLELERVGKFKIHNIMLNFPTLSRTPRSEDKRAGNSKLFLYPIFLYTLLVSDYTHLAPLASINLGNPSPFVNFMTSFFKSTSLELIITSAPISLARFSRSQFMSTMTTFLAPSALLTADANKPIAPAPKISTSWFLTSILLTPL